jgi:hypothetical protein
MNLMMRKIRIMRRFHYALWMFGLLLLSFDFLCTGQSQDAKPEKVQQL